MPRGLSNFIACGHHGAVSSSADAAAVPEITVENNEAAHRYEVMVDGELAGLTTYLCQDDRVVFDHAEVYPRFEGHGIGGALAGAALSDVIAQGKVITPVCPFIVDYLARHPAYLKHVDDAHREEIESMVMVADDDEVAQ